MIGPFVKIDNPQEFETFPGVNIEFIKPMPKPVISEAFVGK